MEAEQSVAVVVVAEVVEDVAAERQVQVNRHSNRQTVRRRKLKDITIQFQQCILTPVCFLLSLVTSSYTHTSAVSLPFSDPQEGHPKRSD